MKKYKVLNTIRYDDCLDALNVFDDIAEVHTIKATYKAVYEAIPEYDAYLTSLEVPVDEGIVRVAKRLKVVGSPSTGTDHLDLQALSEAGIRCFDIAKEFDLIRSFTATSELAFALLLNVNRKIISAAHAAVNGHWGREDFTGFQLSGKTFGILGLGRLGTISAGIAQGFGMQVIANDVRQVSVPGVTLVDFPTLCRQADVLCVHVHLRDDTRGIINQHVFELMKPTSILINTSRGAVVNEQDLLEALKRCRIAGAGLDVIDGEWCEDIQAHPLIKYAREYDNVLITPHIGGATHESIVGARIFMAKKVADFLLNYSRR